VGLAAETGAELVLLHVLPSLAAYTTPKLAGALSVSLQRKARAAAQREANRLRWSRGEPPWSPSSYDPASRHTHRGTSP
jgi:hypothetical protein